MKSILFWAAIVIGAGVVLYALHRLALWAEARGWIYYRSTKHGSSGTLGNALLEIQAMIDPGKKIVLQEIRREKNKTEESESGDPPEPGKDSDPRSSRRPAGPS